MTPKQLLDQFYNVSILYETILEPKRKYKNPVLQKLSNRWYGYKPPRYVATATARPLKKEFIQPYMEPLSLWGCNYDEAKPSLSSMKIKRLILPVISFKIEYNSHMGYSDLSSYMMYHLEEFLYKNDVLSKSTYIA